MTRSPLSPLQAAQTSQLLALEVVQHTLDAQAVPPPADLDGNEAPPPVRPFLLDRRPLENEFDVMLELISSNASPDGPNEPHPHLLGSRCFNANRHVTTRSALTTLRERLCQLVVIHKAMHQVPMGAANTDAGHLGAVTADLLHEASVLLTIVEVAVHEEHHFQVTQAAVHND